MEQLPLSESKRHIVEALLFASDEPLTSKQISDIMRSSEDGGPRIRVSDDEVLGIIRELNSEYVQAGRSFRIVHAAGGFQFATMPDFAQWLGRLAKDRARRKLTQAALETLAVVAYKQPVTKPEVEAIRGVNADYAVQKLLERGMITIVGRAATPGRPLLYGTTSEFLKHFGINDLSELPKPREIEEILADQTDDMEKEILKRMGKTDEEIEEALGQTVVDEKGNLSELPFAPPDDPTADVPKGDAPKSEETGS
jgi:segregation and condensation protein B